MRSIPPLERIAVETNFISLLQPPNFALLCYKWFMRKCALSRILKFVFNISDTFCKNSESSHSMITQVQSVRLIFKSISKQLDK